MATVFCVHSKTIEQFKWINCKKYILYLSKANKKKHNFFASFKYKMEYLYNSSDCFAIWSFFPLPSAKKLFRR